MNFFFKFLGFLVAVTLGIEARDIGVDLTAPIRDHQARAEDLPDEALEIVTEEVAAGIVTLRHRLIAGIVIIGTDRGIRRLNVAVACGDHLRNQQMFR